MDVDPPTVAYATAEGGTGGTQPKKFKLDPMSLLLPHERHLYTQSALPSSAKHTQQAEAYAAMMAQQQQQPVTRPADGRQTSSMGEQSGGQGQRAVPRE
jgi:protein kinase A